MSRGWTHRYHEWLVSFVESGNEMPEFSHYLLLEKLDQINFIYLVPGDRNRYDDGRYLRVRFGEEIGDPGSYHQRAGEPTMLEVFIALAERMSFHNPSEDILRDTSECFWAMMRNIGVWDISDAVYMDDPEYSLQRIEAACDIVNNRQYTSQGVGGPFPVQLTVNILKNQDARQTELWYQMQAYLLENSDLTR